MRHPHGSTRDDDDEAAAAATTTRRRRRQPFKSDVWGSFTRNRPGAGGGPATATCGECGQTLRAGSASGTSHLRRHTGTKRCQQRAAERRRRQQLAATPPPGGGDQDDDDEQQFFVVDGVDIPELLDDLVGKGLASIDESSSSEADDGHVCPCAVPQAASSSTKWFIQKKKEKREHFRGSPDSPGAAATTTTATIHHHYSHASNK